MITSSPAERFAATKNKANFPLTNKFHDSQIFDLDDFQLRGCHALEAGDSILIAAPTGSGKTILGEFAIFQALAQKKKVFYTTPIKALSNQKYQDFSLRFGAEKVGLLTGDNSINSEAQVLVMTTEILRNMIYANSHTLNNLGFVIMDEVHYLADRFRGAVWEETLIHLPESIQVVSLSATVSNAEEFGEWLQSIRGNTKVIVSDKRPVPLFQQVMIGNSLFDLFTESGKVNPEVLREERANFREFRGRKYLKGAERLSKPEIIEKLARENYLPLIYFIFSRGACDQAVEQCLRANLRLTSKEEKEEIDEIVRLRTSHLESKDLEVLGFHKWLDGLRRGFAAHHAGLIPVFKETVEELFQENLLKVVFATETLALGINMPARTVLLDRLSKWNGEAHVGITPGEYTQLTGRAGRRGIDVEGNAVILWSEEIDASSAAGLASTRTYPLRSSFKPSYNMSINLVTQMGKQRAKASLTSSFAQFQADKAVVNLQQQLLKNESMANDLKETMKCHLGDFYSYAQLRQELKNIETDLRKRSGRQRLRLEEEISSTRNSLRNHPCHQCSERESHARIGEKYFRLHRESEGIQNRINSRTNVIPREFDGITSILEEMGYLEGESVTELGSKLSRIYSEADLLICETFRQGIMSGLDSFDFAAVLSVFIYEARKDSPIIVPNLRVQEKVAEIAKIWLKIHDREIESNVEETRSIDLGFMSIAHSWAKGKSISSILEKNEIGIGDFIRSMRQLIDLLRQLAKAYPEYTEVINKSLIAIDRGIVSYAVISQ